MILCINKNGGGILTHSGREARRCNRSASHDLRERRSEALRGGDPCG